MKTMLKCRLYCKSSGPNDFETLLVNGIAVVFNVQWCFNQCYKQFFNVILYSILRRVKLLSPSTAYCYNND
jgi:hypothetical protein